MFADELIGEQQVVVKNLSKFINKVKGISGFALLGDGRISMILDPSGFVTV
ncbi:chemotaxis protein CheW [Sphaerochaeta sp. S2]|uniref:chemotaxis protein CheW n=1 Tax=Sphaerochaeta sp. S2 TaxID=2798868 RepID=UPI00351C08E2